MVVLFVAELPVWRAVSLTCTPQHSAVSSVFHFYVQPNCTQFQGENQHGNRVMIVVNIVLLLVDLNYMLTIFWKNISVSLASYIKVFCLQNLYVEETLKSSIRLSLLDSHTKKVYGIVWKILRSKIIFNSLEAIKPEYFHLHRL